MRPATGSRGAGMMHPDQLPEGSVCLMVARVISASIPDTLAARTFGARRVIPLKSALPGTDRKHAGRKSHRTAQLNERDINGVSSQHHREPLI